jgi:hypothetical protein
MTSAFMRASRASSLTAMSLNSSCAKTLSSLRSPAP